MKVTVTYTQSFDFSESLQEFAKDEGKTLSEFSDEEIYRQALDSLEDYDFNKRAENYMKVEVDRTKPTPGFMKLEDAIEIVTDLARQNIVEPDPGDEDLEAEAERQEIACGTVEDFFCNTVSN